MRPSEVRQRVLSDHEELRRQLAQLEAAARAVLSATPSGWDLRGLGESLLDRLASHLSWEDLHLVPVVREAEGRDGARAARIARDHRDQRELLGYALRQLHDRSRPEYVIASNLLDLIKLLHEDMREEERAILDERLLHDDPASVDRLIGRGPGTDG